MIETSNKMNIPCSKQELFSYLDKPRNHQQFTPSLKSVRNIEDLENGGKAVDYTYSIYGVNFDGRLEEVEREEDERMVFEITGGIQGEIELQLEETEGEETTMTYIGRYSLYNRLLEVVASPLVKRYNNKEIESLLSNIRSEFV